MAVARHADDVAPLQLGEEGCLSSLWLLFAEFLEAPIIPQRIDAPGVAPCFPSPNGKRSAMDYAQHDRFGGSLGEIRVCDETGKTNRQNNHGDGEQLFEA